MSVLAPTTESAIFSRLIDLDRQPLTPAAARYILSLEFSAEDRDRMNMLGQKANQGTLTLDERHQLDSYVHVGDLLALWHSKARRALASASSADECDA